MYNEKCPIRFSCISKIIKFIFEYKLYISDIKNVLRDLKDVYLSPELPNS